MANIVPKTIYMIAPRSWRLISSQLQCFIHGKGGLQPGLQARLQLTFAKWFRVTSLSNQVLANMNLVENEIHFVIACFC